MTPRRGRGLLRSLSYSGMIPLTKWLMGFCLNKRADKSPQPKDRKHSVCCMKRFRGSTWKAGIPLLCLCHLSTCNHNPAIDGMRETLRMSHSPSNSELQIPKSTTSELAVLFAWPVHMVLLLKKGLLGICAKP